MKPGQDPLLDKQEELTNDDAYYVVPTKYHSRSCNLGMKEGQSYLIRTEGKGVDPYVRLEDGQRTILAESGSPQGLPSVLLMSCQKSGSYHLVAGATQERPSGSVTVRVEPLVETLNQDSRLEAADPRLTLPTPWRRAELTQHFDAGASCLLELASPHSDAGLTIEASEDRPSLPSNEDLPGSSRIAFTPEHGGDYRLVVRAKSAGPFTVLIRPLKSHFERAEALTLADAVDSQPTQRYRKTASAPLPDNQPCAVLAESQAFEPLVRVLDAKGQEAARTELPTSIGRIGLFTPTGEGPHTLVMTSRDSLQTGPCRVRLLTLTTGLDKSDRLAADDPLDRRETGKLCKIYDYATKPDLLYLATLSSAKFQSQLRLEDSRGRTVASTSAPLGGPILFQPQPSETYRMVVTSTSAGQFGPFKLSVQPFTTTLLRTEGLVPTDPIDRVLTARRCKVYEQEVEKDKTYIVQMAGEKFVPLLRLEDGQGNEVRQQIGGVGLPARIVFFPERSEKYKIIASSAGSGQTGDFSLQVSTAQETFSEAGKLSSDDPFDPLQNQSFQKIHGMKLKAGNVYILHLESAEFQPFLRLDTSRGRHLRVGPDSFSPHSARIVFTPDQDDTYRVIVTTVNAQGAGAYRLWREE